jgi:hypothetical protein
MAFSRRLTHQNQIFNTFFGILQEQKYGEKMERSGGGV